MSIDVCVFVFDLLFVGDAQPAAAAGGLNHVTEAMKGECNDRDRGSAGEDSAREDGISNEDSGGDSEARGGGGGGGGGGASASAAEHSPAHPHVHDMSLRERRAMLAAALPGLGRMPGRFEMAQSIEIEVQAPTAGAAASAGAEASARSDAAGGVAAADTEDVKAEVGAIVPPASATITTTALALVAAPAALPPPPAEAWSLGGAAVEAVESFMAEALDAACEGLMLKRLDGPHATYSPSKRADSWLKVKTH